MRIALAGVGAFIALFALELLLRVPPLKDLVVIPAFVSPPWQSWTDPAWGNPSAECYRRHPVLGYEHNVSIEMPIAVAGHPRGRFLFRTNNLGLRRSSDTAARAEPGRSRILVLGDSQADGYVDNEETFSTLLEQRLSVDSHPPPEVLNAGVTGYSPAQQYLWYQVRGSALSPALVISLVSLGNDVAELGDPTKPSARGDDERSREWTAPETPGPGRAVSDRSRILLLLRHSLRSLPISGVLNDAGVPIFDSRAGGVPIGTLTAILRECHGCFWQHLQQVLYARDDPRQFDRDLRAVSDVLVRLAEALRADGGRTLVALLPTRMDVEPERAAPELTPITRLLGLGAADLEVQNRVALSLEAALTRAGVPVVSLLGSLRASAARGPLYYDRDWHLTPLGHVVVAEALAHAIAERGLLQSGD
jgi:hypothetical protein